MYLDIHPKHGLGTGFHIINTGLELKRLEILAFGDDKIVITQFDNNCNLVSLFIPNTKLEADIS